MFLWESFLGWHILSSSYVAWGWQRIWTLTGSSARLDSISQFFERDLTVFTITSIKRVETLIESFNFRNLFDFSNSVQPYQKSSNLISLRLSLSSTSSGFHFQKCRFVAFHLFFNIGNFFFHIETREGGVPFLRLSRPAGSWSAWDFPARIAWGKPSWLRTTFAGFHHETIMMPQHEDWLPSGS